MMRLIDREMFNYIDHIYGENWQIDLKSGYVLLLEYLEETQTSLIFSVMNTTSGYFAGELISVDFSEIEVEV